MQPRWGSLCQVFSYFWWVVALHMFVLAATAAAWATRNVINFRASLWGLLTVAIHGATVAAWNANCFRQGPAQVWRGCCRGWLRHAACVRLHMHAWARPPSARCRAPHRLQGAHEESVTVLLYGLAIAMAGDFLFMATGDAL